MFLLLLLFQEPDHLPLGDLISMPNDHDFAGIIVVLDCKDIQNCNTEVFLEEHTIPIRVKNQSITFHLPDGSTHKGKLEGEQSTFTFPKWSARSIVFVKYRNKWIWRPGYYYSTTDESGERFLVNPFLNNIVFRQTENEIENIGKKSILLNGHLFKLKPNYEKHTVQLTPTEEKPVIRGEKVPPFPISKNPLRKDETYLLCFSPPSCRGSKETKPILDELGKNPNLILIGIVESAEEKNAYEDWAFPGETIVLKDAEDLFQVRGSPIFFLIRNGEILDRFDNGSQLKERIEEKLSQLNNP